MIHGLEKYFERSGSGLIDTSTSHSSEVTGENHTWVSIASVYADIRTEHHPNTTLESYHHWTNVRSTVWVTSWVWRRVVWYLPTFRSYVLHPNKRNKQQAASHTCYFWECMLPVRQLWHSVSKTVPQRHQTTQSYALCTLREEFYVLACGGD
jgi:hypothetical protein